MLYGIQITVDYDDLDIVFKITGCNLVFSCAIGIHIISNLTRGLLIMMVSFMMGQVKVK